MTKKRVLVVDDNDNMRELLPYVLEDAGYEVELATNGEQAFRMACQRSPDLILTDLSMPDVDGIELIRLLRTDAFLKTLPIIAMTGFGAQRVLEARDAGASLCLDKPVQHAELLGAIDRLTRASIPPPPAPLPVVESSYDRCERRR